MNPYFLDGQRPRPNRFGLADDEVLVDGRVHRRIELPPFGDGVRRFYERMMISNRPISGYGTTQPRPWVADLTEHEIELACIRDFLMHYDGVITTVRRGKLHSAVPAEVQAKVRQRLVDEERALGDTGHERKTLAAAVRKLSAHYTVREIAEVIGIPKSTVHRWRNGLNSGVARKSGTPQTYVETQSEEIEENDVTQQQIAEVMTDLREIKSMQRELLARLGDDKVISEEVDGLLDSLGMSSAEIAPAE